MTSEKLLVDVVNLHKFDSFSELYKHFDKILLGYDESELADDKIWKSIILKMSKRNMVF